MKNIIVIFDLDFTLVNARNRVPRQTHHALRSGKSVCQYGIISHNVMAHWIAAATQLDQYTGHIFCGLKQERNELFEQCLNSFDIHSETKVYYIDDREDHLHLVQQYFPSIHIYHCRDMYKMHRYLHDIIREHMCAKMDIQEF